MNNFDFYFLILVRLVFFGLVIVSGYALLENLWHVYKGYGVKDLFRYRFHLGDKWIKSGKATNEQRAILIQRTIINASLVLVVGYLVFNPELILGIVYK